MSADDPLREWIESRSRLAPSEQFADRVMAAVRNEVDAAARNGPPPRKAVRTFPERIAAAALLSAATLVCSIRLYGVASLIVPSLTGDPLSAIGPLEEPNDVPLDPPGTAQSSIHRERADESRT